MSNFNSTGLITATVAGALGAIGAACIIWSFRNGGSPALVMPLVFGGAPLVNVLVTMVLHPPKSQPHPAAVRRLPAGRGGRLHRAALQAVMGSGLNR